MKVTFHVKLKGMGTFLICLIIAACSSAPSFNPYQGSLKDLIPEEIDMYKRGKWDFITETNSRQESFLFKQLDASGGIQAEYESSGNKASISLLIYNFSSTDKALIALHQIKQLNQVSAKIEEEGPKKNGWKEVGERFYSKNSDFSYIGWTNGSVLFFIKGYKDYRDDVLNFDKAYPY